MKTMTLIIAAMLIITAGYAQKKDTTKIILGNSKILIINEGGNPNDNAIIINDTTKVSLNDAEDNDSSKSESAKDRFDGHWAGIDLGINNYMTSDNATEFSLDDKYLELNQGKSWYVSLNLIEQNIPILKNRIGLVTGLGLSISNYRFKNNTTLIADSAYSCAFRDTVNKFTKNKLTASYLNLPLILEFQIPVGKGDDNNIHIAAGAIGGLRIGSHTKQMFEADGAKFNIKDHNDYHLATWSYSVTARIGYKGLNVFANYDLAGLFQEGEGPELYPFQVGVSFAGF
jgi:hypothetical protein